MRYLGMELAKVQAGTRGLLRMSDDFDLTLVGGSYWKAHDGYTDSLAHSACELDGLGTSSGR